MSLMIDSDTLSSEIFNRYSKSEPFTNPFRACSPLLNEYLIPKAPEPVAGADLSWREWLRTFFPHVCTFPFAERHERLWEWFEALEPGSRPRPRVEVWGRGGAKSATGELGAARVGVKLSRRYVLYVSESQEQADKHVQSIASLFGSLGVERAVNRYGSSKGWRRDQLRTANGFNVSAFGLDTAARGVKLDHYRPDLILLDDVDNQADSIRTVEKKIDALTTAIIPTGSPDCAILFLQNLIHEEGIVAQLVDGRADFLRDREPAQVEPAVRGLVTTTETTADGSSVYRITGGTATWEGQPLATCERQINDWGLRAFLREAQHEVAGADGYVFDVKALRYIEPDAVPAGLTFCRAWDLAGTEGGGDWTVGVLMGRLPNRQALVLDMQRYQYGSDNVRALIAATARRDKETYGNVTVRLPQDPGQAGVDQAKQIRALLAGYSVRVQPVTGKKWDRASGFADRVNSGNVSVVRGEWNRAFSEELRKFREDELDQADDIVDAAADAWNTLDASVKWIVR